MATSEHTGTQPLPFSTGSDIAHVVCAGKEPALQINPQASTNALLGAAMGRADRLNSLLFQLAVASGGCEMDASACASNLQPLAEEITILLSALQKRVITAKAVA